MSARIRHLWLAWLAAGSVACGEPPAPLALPDASAVTLEGVAGPIDGTIAGQPFHVIDARFRVVRYAGRERVDVLFADHAIERCGLPLARAQTRVWLRVPGLIALLPGELTLLDEPAEDAPLQVHYETPNGRLFSEVHRGVARLEITSAASELVEGRVHVCFADATQSCVAGVFRATPCRGRVDGRSLREPPGLADEALEPLPTTGVPAESGP